MKIGTKVIISDRSKEYQGKYVNEIGVIKRGNCFSEGLGKVGVELDNYPNYRSGYSVFWFEESVLDIYESEDECVMLNGYKLAGVSFVDGRNQDTIYTYAMYDEELAVGDMVVVKTGHHGLAVAKIVTFDKESLGKVRCDREIICKVDMSAYEERKEKAARVAEIKLEMDAKVKELQSQVIYELLAEKDQTLKTLLDEYRTLLN